MIRLGVKIFNQFSIISSLLLSIACIAKADPTTLPLFSIEQLEYQGAFRLPTTNIGEANANWASGVIAYNHRNHSLFFAGHAQYQAVAEFKIPELVITDKIDKLKTALPLQGFTRIFKRTTSNPDALDRITGMYFDYGRLLINTINFYDAEAKAKNTSLVIHDALNLNQAKDLKFYDLEFGARAAGWISPIPAEWRDLLDADIIVGNGNGWPINSRLSIGPSAFKTNIRNYINADITNEKIRVTPLQYFSINKPLTHDLLNKELKNNLLTELSKPIYGFIVPNTRTYLVIGSSGGHQSGIGYKLKRKHGNCSGYCTNDPDDLTNYYWLWDVNDWLKVIGGKIKPYDIRPYEYGRLRLQFDLTKDFNPVVGATFDKFSNCLWLTMGGADSEAGKYNNPPIISAYSLNINSRCSL